MRNIFTIFKKSAILTGALCIMLITVACSTEENAEPLATGQASLPTVATSSENDTTNEQDEQIEEAQVTENDYQALIDFLSEMTTIFTGVPREDVEWTDEGPVLTGRFWLGWDSEAGQPITTYELPEIYLSGVGAARFYDALGNQIENAPWMYVQRYDDETLYNYAGYFKLYDFGNGEMPVVFIHFNQTFDGGYAGHYKLYRYVDGEYHYFPFRSFRDGEENPWWMAQVGLGHRFFQTEAGEIIVQSNNDYSSVYSYEQLVMRNDYAELLLISSMGDGGWDAWQAHHWQEWDFSDGRNPQLVGSWLDENPVIFGTSIAIQPLPHMERERDDLLRLLRQ